MSYYNISKMIEVTLNDGSTIITTTNVVDSKRYPVSYKSIKDITHFCFGHNIPLEDTTLHSKSNGDIDLVHLIFENEETIKEKLEQKRQQEYEQYLELKKKFG